MQRRPFTEDGALPVLMLLLGPRVGEHFSFSDQSECWGHVVDSRQYHPGSGNIEYHGSFPSNGRVTPTICRHRENNSIHLGWAAHNRVSGGDTVQVPEFRVRSRHTYAGRGVAFLEPIAVQIVVFACVHITHI